MAALSAAGAAHHAPPAGDNSADEFYESLDRVFSSSSTSTSDNSDGEGRCGVSAAGDSPSPSPFTSVSVWLASPAPVADRRRRLLQLMGLGADASLARSASCGAAAFGLPPTAPVPLQSPAVAHVVRSRSDGTAGAEDPRCLIKNLDNGTEFVVVEEDKRMREVGTGRQLTIEEFELCVGRSPIVQELMRRASSETISINSGRVDDSISAGTSSAESGFAARAKKRSSWLRSIKKVVSVGNGNGRERRSSDDSGGRRSSSATDDSQDGPSPQRMAADSGPQRIKVRHCGKPHKEFSGLYMNQSLEAHIGSIWSIRFSVDGRYLATAGEDRVIQVWEVTDAEWRGELVLERRVEDIAGCIPLAAAVNNASLEKVHAIVSASDGSYYEKKRRAKAAGGRKSGSVDHVMMPDHVFALSEKPTCSFRGHSDDVLDLSWSKSMYLLSSSMDKTVRLWHMSSQSCLKIFSHTDYVTCIQFNPVDDRYFISGSLDEKVRLWSIPDRQILDWFDVHEMVTAVCYNPDGQSALVGTHKGSCHLYDTSENKLLQKSQVDLQNKKKKAGQKKITGFQFVPGRSSRVLITSADSRIRVIDGVDLVHKFKGFCNTNSQISACLTSNQRYAISASEDSHVYIWQYDDDLEPSRSKGVVSVTNSYEHFHCRHVTAAVAWPCIALSTSRTNSCRHNDLGQAFNDNSLVLHGSSGHRKQCSGSLSSNSSQNGGKPSSIESEDVISRPQGGPSNTEVFHVEGITPAHSAWGLVIVAAGRGGEIRVYQNFGLPV